ncbi:hypothetical protein HDU97_009218 [Phlyctochytrium planicorne]|nr:hypothetical protein HDU97_009218 [Phlyctochytrium planicorne]
MEKLGAEKTHHRPTLRRKIAVVDPQAAAEERKRLQQADPARKWLKYLPWMGIIPSFGIVGVIIWLTIRSVPNYKYCMVLQDDFNSDKINTDVWSFEQGVDGFGNGEFQAYTSDERTAYVRNGKLHIKPMLTTDFGITLKEILDGYTLNLTEKYGCQGGDQRCVKKSNYSVADFGNIINPVMSAKLRLKKPYATKYGKGEIKLKLPRGDWLWPAVWLMPEDSVYGDWPRSGELDIIESRGNNAKYRVGGNDKMISNLQYGVSSIYRKSIAKQIKRRHGTLASSFHTIGWEWTPNYFLTWLDSPLRTNLYVSFKDDPLTKDGGFPNKYANDTSVVFPDWRDVSSPFDKEFYLILNVAVGGTNGFFPDSEGNKPWQNSDSPGRAMYKFLEDIPNWYNSTWPEDDDRALQIDYVKTWKICDIQ